jgi:hypothetical protein
VLNIVFSILQATWNRYKFYFPSFVFKPWVLFSRTRESAGDITNQYAISYCLSTLFFLKLWKNLMSYAFSSGKTCEKYSEFPVNQKFVRIILWRLQIMGLSRLGTRLVVVFLYGMRPHAETGRQYSVSYWRLTRIRLYNAILCLFCGVKHGSLLGWSVSVAGWAVRFHAVFMLSFSRDRDHAGCAEIGSGNRTEPWLAPNKMGLIRFWSGCCERSPIHPWVDFGHSSLGSRTKLTPVQCSNNNPTTTPSEQEREIP